MKAPSCLALLFALSRTSPIEGFLPSSTKAYQTYGLTTSDVSNGCSKASTAMHMSLTGKIAGRIRKRKEQAIDKLKDRVKERIKQRYFNKIEDLTVDKLIGTLEDPADSSIKILEDLDDLFTTVVLAIVPQKLIDMNDSAFTSENFTNMDEELEERFDIGWRKSGDDFNDWVKGFIPAEIVEVTDNGVQIKRIRTDAFYGEPTIFMNIITEISGSNIIFPLNDAISFFNSKEECDTLVTDTKLQEKSKGGATPDPYPESHWEGEKSSDENFSRFFFNGIGAALLEQQVDESSKPDLGPIEIDIDFMKVLEMREGFRPMGVKVYFDIDQKVTGIYDSAKEKMFAPGDDGWEGAKFLATSSAGTLLTAREHLFQCHLLCSNYLSLASIKHLPPSHPIRRLVNVHTFRTNSVNDLAFSTLVRDSGALHRAVGFEYDSMLTIFDKSFQNCNVWEPFPKRNMRPEILEMSSSGKFPYHSEAVEYYSIVESFVREWLGQAGDAATDGYAEAFYNEIRDSTMGQKYELPEFDGLDSLVNVLSQGIFIVTCYHEIIGTVIEYVTDPSLFFAFRVLEDDTDGKPATQADVQSYMLMRAVVASTGLDVPMLMKPYKYYFGEDGAPEWEKEKWNGFIEDLEKQSKKVKESDEKREVQFLFMDPERFESAISV